MLCEFIIGFLLTEQLVKIVVIIVYYAYYKYYYYAYGCGYSLEIKFNILIKLNIPCAFESIFVLYLLVLFLTTQLYKLD